MEKNKYIKDVKKFMVEMRQEIASNPYDVIYNVSLIKLRLDLILEELIELGCEGYGHDGRKMLMDNYLSKVSEVDRKYQGKKFENPNIQMALDALVDLQYVLSGAVLALGFEDVFEEAWDAVQESNMSKICEEFSDACDTVDYYTSQGVQTTIVDNPETGKFIVVREPDKKVLKNVNYIKADKKLAEIVKRFDK